MAEVGICYDGANHPIISAEKNMFIRHCEKLPTSGSCGEIYLCNLNEEYYILKTFNFRDPAEIEKVALNKGRKLFRSMDLQHKNFIPIVAVTAELRSGCPFYWGYLMPVITDPFPKNPSIDFLEQSNDALMWGHDKGIFIVDIGPYNIMNNDGIPVIIDRDGHSIISEEGDRILPTEDVPDTFFRACNIFNYKMGRNFNQQCLLLKNIDIINFSEMALYFITKNPFWRPEIISKDQIASEIKALRKKGLIGNEEQEHMENIFSDSLDKVYPRLVLREISARKNQ